jgi:decaprenylphospho-beta-D-ribofuranose 2-oxidase
MAVARQETAPVRLLSGWGRTAATRATVVGPLEPDRLAELMVDSRTSNRGLLARGAGCSYGDAAQNAGGIVVAPPTERLIEVDVQTATVRASSATTFADLLNHLVPHGLLLPVIPGTGHLTLGGAVAADVHGKNHHVDGSISAWIESIELIGGDGRPRTLTPGGDGPGFRATVGGMGLTGVILAATLRLLPIRSARMQVTVRRAANLDELMTGLYETDSRYAVAWIDGTADGRALGRGVLDLGDHLDAPDPATEPRGLHYRAIRCVRAPQLPFSPVTPMTARAFNSLWFHKAPRESQATASLGAFFHRLDAVSQWNRMLGPQGFVQYQFAVPHTSGHLVAEALRTLQRGSAAPFLGTLKHFGRGNDNPLSFPLAGWSLAVDLPVGRHGLAGLLDGLDRRIADAGGRVYLAKDARLGRACFTDMYGPLDQWHAARDELDPHGVMRSDLGRRLGLCR